MRPIEDNQPFLNNALNRIKSIITILVEHNIPLSHTYIMGFSQGACIAAQYLWEYQQPIKGVIALTGGLFGHSLESAKNADNSSKILTNTKALFTGHENDSWVPAHRIVESSKLLNSIGIITMTRIYEGSDHIVTDDEINLIRDLLKQ